MRVVVERMCARRMNQKSLEEDFVRQQKDTQQVSDGIK
jgi:hypothetical protein